MADYGSLQDHADAVLALLYAAANLTVYPAADGGPQLVPNGATPPYVAVHMAAVRPSGGRLTTRSTRLVARIYCHCVGINDVAARAVADLVAGALLDERPVIVGRVVYPIRSEVTGPPDTNDSTGFTYVSLTDTYRLETTPGT